MDARQRWAACLDGTSLQLILLPTEACNFRCTYCYESFRLGRMAPWVVRGVKRLISARGPDLRRLTVSWFGGEPLLALDRVEEVAAHAQAVARAHPALELVSDMTTNAWHLTRPTFERLLALGVRHYQVSFDGPPELHDQKRVLAGGGPTFERVWSNVLATRDVPEPFRFTLRVHVDGENLAHVERLVERMRAEFGDDPRYAIYLRGLSRYGGPNDARLRILETPEEQRALAALQRAESDRLPATPADGSAEAVCHAARAGSFVVRADGRLEKCTVALDRPANAIGRLREDGTLELDAPQHRRWLRGAVSGDPFELFCPLWGIEGAADARAAS